MKKLSAGLVAILTLGMIMSIYGHSPVISGRPPEFSVVSNPFAIPDGSGGVIVAYQVNSGNYVNTYVQRLGVQGETLWGKKGIELGSGSGGFGVTGATLLHWLLSGLAMSPLYIPYDF